MARISDSELEGLKAGVSLVGLVEAKGSRLRSTVRTWWVGVRSTTIRVRRWWCRRRRICGVVTGRARWAGVSWIS